MKIRKQFRVESAHIVRNCHTERCKKSIHGHSAVIEVILKGDQLDNAGMLMDFNVMNTIVKPIVDLMDHAILLYDRDNIGYLQTMTEYSDRYLIFGFNPSAENLAIWLHFSIDQLLSRVLFANGEGYIQVDSIKYHETTTGYAESEYSDIYCDDGSIREDVLNTYNNYSISDACYSDLPVETKNILSGNIFKMETPEQQIINK